MRVLDRRLIFYLGLLGLLFTFLYHSALRWLVQFWLLGDKAYSHGFLVPLISLYLVWAKREHLAQLDPRPSPIAGSLVLLTSGLLLLAGRAGGLVLAEAISFLVFLPGLVLFVWGWGHLKALALPLAYLQFMVPWMDEFIETIHWPFQLLSANLGVWILQTLDLSALQEGQYIFLPRITLEVAQACSGVRYLTSVIAIGIPLVYLTQRVWWRAAGVLVSGVVITVLANSARVALAGILAYYYGPEMLHGPFKIFQGWFVAQVGFIGLFLVNWALTKLPSRSQVKLQERWKAFPHKPPRPDEQKSLARPLGFVLLFLIGLGVYVHLLATPRPVPPKRALAEFPYSLGEWYGRESARFKGDRFFPGVNAELTRVYRTTSWREVHLYVGYFDVQRQGKSLINYQANPLRESMREVPIDLGFLGPQRANRSTLSIGEDRYTVLFWYWYPSGEMTGRYQVKFRAIIDALARWRNNGAVILLAAPLNDKGEEASVSNDLVAFARVAAPTLHELLR